jgi:hypothetical protein
MVLALDQTFGAGYWRIQKKWCVKFYLTDRQELGLLCVGGRCNLLTLDPFNQRRTQMTNQIYLIARVAQGLLAVSATIASVLVFQL